jgi:4-hydroxyphenylpyruvate dioxygenase
MEAMAITIPTAAPRSTAAEFLTGWDHLELWVGNGRVFSHFLQTAFGFTCTAYAGPETGVRDRASYVLEQGAIRLVVTSGLSPDSFVVDHVRLHGDGVRAIALAVSDVDGAFEAAIGRGATALEAPRTVSDDFGSVRAASCATYGDTTHVFVDRTHYRGPFGPGFVAVEASAPTARGPVGLSGLDHVVGNVEEGRLDTWVEWYEHVLGFTQMRHFDADQVSTSYSALRSTVMWNGSDVVLPINEPSPGRRKSQIQEYLDAYVGPGVQHTAFATPDIVVAVDELQRRGVRFLVPPPAYYEDARQRCGHLDVPWRELERLGILVDTDSGGYLLQVFTETLADRPTLFVEVIQRAGATGFGDGNFKALFEAIEREQARRGNL